MIKTFVLDTNVLLHSPQSLMVFGDNKVVIPEVVLEELDRFKKENNELGANARHVARFIDSLRSLGKLNEGIKLDNGGILKVEMNHYDIDIPKNWDRTKADNRILQICKGLMKNGEKVYLVTKDIFERIKADIVDVVAQDFTNEMVPVYNEQYKARKSVYTSCENIDLFYKQGYLERERIKCYSSNGEQELLPELEINEFVIIHDNNNIKHTALGRYDGHKIVSLIFGNKIPFGISPRNTGQKFMQEALFLDPDRAPLVIIKGPAGTAKTLYALAVGLHKVMESEKREYRKILICRPNVTMDEEIGFLPGTEEDKIAPFMRPIRDNLQILMDSDEEKRYINEKELEDKVDELFDRKIITTEALAYLRGRSIIKQWIIIDEAQNLTPKQVKGIVTRAGMGTKIILLGDPEQIDHPFLDIRTNGLSYASEKMRGSNLCYQVSMFDTECERSPLAKEASQRM